MFFCLLLKILLTLTAIYFLYQHSQNRLLSNYEKALSFNNYDENKENFNRSEFKRKDTENKTEWENPEGEDYNFHQEEEAKIKCRQYDEMSKDSEF